MTYAVVGSPAEGFGDAVLGALLADVPLSALVGTRVYSATPEHSRTPLPYVVGGRYDVLRGAPAMQKDGARVGLYLDVWSDQNGPHEVLQILSRLHTILARDRLLTVPGYAVMAGSLECEEEHVIADFDVDMPDRSLFHGIQLWCAELEEV